MATDTYLLDRMRMVLKEKHALWTEKRMFGGDCFLVDDKMCFATIKGGILARVGPNNIDELTAKPCAEQMIHGGRIMTGYLFIEPDGYDLDDDLEFWIEKCLEFNPLANSNKKKNKQ